MDNQYYTPVWEEFHPGFEYEEKREDNGTEEGLNWDSTSEYENLPFFWVKRTFNPAYGSDISDVKFGIENEIIRVRCLNHEDIESLGFSVFGKGDKTFRIKTNTVYMLHLLGGKTVITKDIILPDKSTANTNVFEGSLKNRSELSRIMKQIGMI